MILEARSMPFSTPEAITKCVSPIKTAVQKIGRSVHTRRTVEVAVYCLPDVFECPAGNDRIEAQDQESGQDAVVSDPAPFRPGGHFLERTDRIAAGVAADKEFGYHYRNS